MNTKTLKGKVVTGVFWNTVQLAVNRGFDLILKLVLARLLFPEQFGLIGMAAVFTSFVQVFNDLGIGAALVQLKDEDLREEHYHTAFWTGVAWSILIYLIIYFAVSPLAAKFYNEPILAYIIPVLSIGVLSSPINLVHNAQLTKAMNFRKTAQISNTSKFFSGIVSLALAFMGAGVWSLVFNSVSSFLVAMPLYFRATGWKPKLIWSKEAFNDVFGFGIYTTGTNLLNNLMSKLDYLLIGKLLSASSLGVYTLAFILTDTFRSQVMNIMNKVMYPVYGKKQNDIDSIKRYYLNVVKYNSIVIYPVMTILILYGYDLVYMLYGDKWVEAVIPLKILALSVMFHMMVNSNTSVIRGLGKARLEMKLQLWKSLLLYSPLLIAGVYYYGIIGAAFAFLIIKFLSVFIVQFYMNKLINYEFKDLYNAMKVPVVASFSSALVSYILYSHLGLHFIICSLILFITYSSITYLLMKDEILGLIKFIKT